ncbi:MAG TPA: right-handed parallel beta-helix repeat-containing protein [Candidatus Binataceae bacterium]|nr:right-handed parallel beta-helix repeat-containing protein [Candidatus Binataceae bacterium]
MSAIQSSHRGRPSGFAAAVLLAGFVVGLSAYASAATICVNPRGSKGCRSSIQAAIDSVTASPSVIVIEPGTYSASCGAAACSVASILGSAPNASSLTGLTLECNADNGQSVILDASSLDHGVYVSGVNQVRIEGCVVKNADREGILIENSDNIKIAHNVVKNNDQAMGKTRGTGGPPPCPTFLPPGNGIIVCCPDAFTGGPGNFPDDNDDCGEGIHLRSVTSSVVEGNSVHDNIGGILTTDETGPSHDNLIVNNSSSHNRAFGGDCGVTLASHLGCTAGSTDATGCSPTGGAGGSVFHNNVAGNVLNDNGASGAGMFANPGIPPGSATKAYGNLIADNVIKDNGQPGVGIHVHAENGNADHNVVIENVISGNGGDAEAKPGSPPPGMGIEVLSNGAFGAPFGAAAPIVGTIISQNRVSNEDIDVWVGNTDTDAGVFLNDLLGVSASGVENGGGGTVVATDNYWGCPKGPGKSGCSSASVTGTGTIVSNPFLSHPVSPEK